MISSESPSHRCDLSTLLYSRSVEHVRTHQSCRANNSNSVRTYMHLSRQYYCSSREKSVSLFLCYLSLALFVRAPLMRRKVPTNSPETFRCSKNFSNLLLVSAASSKFPDLRKVDKERASFLQFPGKFLCTYTQVEILSGLSFSQEQQHSERKHSHN